MSERTMILTDLESGTWLDQWRISRDDGLQLAGSENWSIAKRTLRGGVSDGIDVVSVDNGVLAVDVLPTRGMGFWQGSYSGMRLGWNSPARFPVHPSLVNAVEQRGVGWLTGFNEWLCRCGLSSLGEPGSGREEPGDRERDASVTLHGRIANMPCCHVSANVSDEGQGAITVQGVVEEAWLYGPKLRLVSTLTTAAGSSSLKIVDEITNLSDEPGEFQLLYHTNFGPPLLEQGASLVVAVEEVAPYDDSSLQEIDRWREFAGPQPVYAQKCYFAKPSADDNGFGLAVLHNRSGNFGIGLRFDVRKLPCFTLWKNLQGERDGYVCGLEPGTCYPNHISFERQRKRVIALPPGETYETCVYVDVYGSAAEVSDAVNRVHRMQRRECTVHRHIHPDFTPTGGRKV